MGTNKKIGIERKVEGTFDDILAKVETALKVEGFGILTRIDVKATLKEKIDQDFTNYVILGACNPKLAFKALTATKDVGLLMPCNVVVYEDETGAIVVSAVNPQMMSEALPGADLSEVVGPATEKLTSAINSI